MEPKLSRDLADAMIPGVAVEMTPAEAERFGAFEETAVSAEDADDASLDLVGEVADV
jgi:hypothetical protein